MGKGTVAATGINSELRVGDLVVSTGLLDYSYLVGKITGIVKLGTPEHEDSSSNETDDVYVDFTTEAYTENRIREIEAEFSKLYGESKSFDDCPLDCVIMPPEALINITAFAPNDVRSLLDSEEAAKAFCGKFIAGNQQ